MNIIILGAGAIGSFYGARLSKLNEVILIARKEHADKINKNGLKITGLENKTYRLKAAAKVEKIRNKTLVLLTTKVYDSKNAISRIKSLIKKDTIILCLQNGLYSENAVKEVVKGKCAVLRAVTNFGAAFLEPGIIQYNSRSYTAIEESDASHEIARNFSQCGLNCRVSKNIKKDMWKKLILNCVLNPLTSILQVENRVIAGEILNPIKKLIAEECLEVAKKDGVSFDFDFVKSINDSTGNSRNISSMQQDLMKGKLTEIDCLNGAVAEMGRKNGIKCPVNDALGMIIKNLK